MTRFNLIIAATIAAITVTLWAYINSPETEAPWPEVIQGFSFSPMQADDDPIQHKLPSREDIEADLALLSGTTFAVRTYRMEGAFAEIPAMARKYGINVALGAWLDKNLQQNESEVQRLIQYADRYRRNVVRVLVGNEVLLRENLSVDQLIGYIRRVRAQVGMPVSTAEPWHVWLKHPELVKEVDYIGVHMLPYWEGVNIDDAVDFIVERMNELKAKYPDKPIVIAEVGWPSNGRTRRGAVASEANEAIFLRRFLQRADQENYVYYVMEAFDQPWKTRIESGVGAYWGVFDTYRKPKFEFTKPIVEIPQWRELAGLSVVLALVVFALLLIDAKTLNNRGRGFLAVIAYALATAMVWIVYNYTQQYLSLSAIIVGILMLIGMIGVILVVLVESHEWAEALWVKERRRQIVPKPVEDSELPMVSIHVPAYNEPAQMLIKTLDALALLDYPHYEVLVIDNNTRDPEVWKPVQAHCRKLGERFRFFHVDPLSGFKSGALNYALQRTAAEATVIGVIDSDYVVASNWLRDLAPQFEREQIAVVQAPQDYRDVDENAFKAMAYAEYRGFFYIGMVTRNERNAIIQHGTMTLVRRSVLQEVGGWSEWCITEDAELGLMIFREGHEAMYIAKSYGKGLMPDTFQGYSNQRFRWAYGAMQIIRHHIGDLLGFNGGKLSSGQRYHFMAGWLPWIADGVNLLFNLAALGWSVAMILYPLRIDPPLIIFSALPLVLFSFKIAKGLYLYRGARIVGTITQTLAASLAGLALSHTIARAMWLGLFTRNKPFMRTPKMARASALFKALAVARQELLLMVALWTMAGVLGSRYETGTLDLLLWIIVLLVQSIPYLATVVVSMVSAFPSLSANLVCGGSCEEQRTRPAGGTQL